jgi:hypothetical protein
MKTNKSTALAILIAAVFTASSAWASDVYIDQTGDDVEINITQNNGMNTVNSDGSPAVISGDGIRVDLLQDGDLNTASINLGNDSDGTILDYSATGSHNDLTVNLSTAINNSIDITVLGDSNSVSVCGNLTCTDSASVDNTVNVVNIDGDHNSVRFALNASNANNTVSITGGSIGNGNSVDITQNSGANHVTNIGITGGGNAVTIVQGQ